MCSIASVDDIIWSFVDRALSLTPESRTDLVRSEIEQALQRFRETPSSWVVDRMVYGIHTDCAGLEFGKVLLVAEGVATAAADLFPNFPQEFKFLLACKSQPLMKVPLLSERTILSMSTS